MRFFAVLCLLLCSMCTMDAWRLPAARPAVVKNIKTVAAAFMFATYAGNAIDSSSFSLAAPVLEARADESVFVGSYDDPNHPGCLRKITVKGKQVTIAGSDNIDGSKQWALKATEDYPGACCLLLCCAVLCCAVLCCAVLCCAVMCCAVM